MNKYKVGDKVRIKCSARGCGSPNCVRGCNKDVYEITAVDYDNKRVQVIIKHGDYITETVKRFNQLIGEWDEVGDKLYKTPHQELLDLGWELVADNGGRTLTYILYSDGSLHAQRIELSHEGENFYTTLRIIDLQLAKILVRYLEELE